MIIIKNKFIPFGNYSTMNFYGILFTKRDYLPLNTKNHELIHTYLIIELFIISLILISLLISIFSISFWWVILTPSTFYIWYLLEYCIVRFFHKKLHDSYRDISFEEEAYTNEKNLNYLKFRKPFSWFKYLKIKSNIN